MGTCFSEYQASNSFESTYKNVINTLVNWWNENVTVLPDDKYLELALSFYKTLFTAMPSVKTMFTSRDVDMNTQALKMLGMFRWIILTLTNSGLCDNTLIALQQLGALHDKLGLTLDDYLGAGAIFHQTMTQSFTDTYNLRVKWCFNVLYEIMVGVMLGNDFNQVCEKETDKIMSLWKHISDEENSFIDHLNNYQIEIYLPLFMKEQFCIELWLFITDYNKYKLLANDTLNDTPNDDMNQFGEYMKELYIDSCSKQQINISGLCRDEFYHNLQTDRDEEYVYTKSLYDQCYEQVIQLIEISVFPKFKQTIKECVDSINVQYPSNILTKKIDFVYITNRSNSFSDILLNL
eukprot:483307_1